MSFKGTEDNLDNLDINYILNTRSISDKLICTDGFKARITKGYKRRFSIYMAIATLGVTGQLKHNKSCSHKLSSQVFHSLTEGRIKCLFSTNRHLLS